MYFYCRGWREVFLMLTLGRGVEPGYITCKGGFNRRGCNGCSPRSGGSCFLPPSPTFPGRDPMPRHPPLRRLLPLGTPAHFAERVARQGARLQSAISVSSWWTRFEMPWRCWPRLGRSANGSHGCYAGRITLCVLPPPPPPPLTINKTSWKSPAKLTVRRLLFFPSFQPLHG